MRITNNYHMLFLQKDIYYISVFSKLDKIRGGKKVNIKKLSDHVLFVFYSQWNGEIRDIVEIKIKFSSITTIKNDCSRVLFRSRHGRAIEETDNFLVFIKKSLVLSLCSFFRTKTRGSVI